MIYRYIELVVKMLKISIKQHKAHGQIACYLHIDNDNDNENNFIVM